jgi:predicted nucleic acid-binding protein
VIVISDTSVLLNLCRVEQIELLRQLFHDIIIPPEVATEFTRLTCTDRRFKGLTLPSWIRQQACSTHARIPLNPPLHAGEIAALSLALELHADAILIDERSGHAVAQRLGFKTLGILGILLQAKAAGHVQSIRATIERLEKDARFWLSPSLRDRVLRAAGEL